MKLSHLPLFLFILFGVSALASTAQYIDCHADQTLTNDHFVLTFTNSQSGSFSLINTTDPVSISSIAETLVLNRLNVSSADQASFTVNSGSVTFTYQMPNDLVMKASSSFNASMTTEISELGKVVNQSLTCFSKVI